MPMTETKRSKNIAFRLTNTEFARLEKVASATGDDPNAWCRNLALKQSTEAHMFTRDEHLVYEEIATLRLLMGHGDKSLEGTYDKLIYEWNMLGQQASENATEIAQELVRRRQRGSGRSNS
jgi:hypothetical protein